MAKTMFKKNKVGGFQNSPQGYIRQDCVVATQGQGTEGRLQKQIQGFGVDLQSVKAPRQCNGRMNILLINGAETTGYPHKWCTDRNELKTADPQQRPEFKSKIIKLLEENMTDVHDLGLGNRCLDTIWKAQGTKWKTDTQDIRAHSFCASEELQENEDTERGK